VPTLIECLTERGRLNWAVLLAEFEIKVEQGRQRDVMVQPYIEELEEINHLMREKPGFGREDAK
jgi:hypothetical protein